MSQATPKELGFSLMFFAASDDALLESRYELILQSARFADTRGFSSVWVPERHFTDFGCLYPNPAVLHAALARETQTLQLRAGSVVIPLHDPLRIAEEWAMVDNLSGGRVGISAATGWNPNDFAFFPERYASRREEMHRGLATLRSLWRGEPLRVRNGVGKDVDVRIYPKPVQAELPVWLTAAGSPETFARAGEMGLNVLTHLLDHDVDEIADRLALYREARRAHGWDPEGGQVTLMLHTFIGEDGDAVREEVRGPYTSWLKSNAGLLKGLAANRGETVDLEALSREDKDAFANFLFERFYASRSLMGTPESSLALLGRLHGVGVTEIACLLDFGPRAEAILTHLPHLHRLKELYHATGRPDASGLEALRETARATLSARAAIPAIKKAASRESLEDIRARCTDEIAAAEFYERLGRSGAQFGPRLRGIERLWRRDGEALAQVRLVDAANGNGTTMHPPFLDACFQVLGAALPANLQADSGALYLPIGLGTFRQVRPAPEEVWSHARLRSAPQRDPETLEGDVHVLDAEGDLVCEVRGFRLQRTALDVDVAEDPVSEWLYGVRWQAKDLVTAGDDAPGMWVIFADGQGVGDALADALEERGHRCVRVRRGEVGETPRDGDAWIAPEDPEAVRGLLESLIARDAWPLKGLVHLWSLDAPPLEQTDAAALARAQASGPGTVLRIVQALQGPALAGTPRLWLVTRGAQAVAESAAAVSPVQALLWGFGKTIAVEQPDLWGGLVDLDPAAPGESARQVHEAVTSDHAEGQIGFRGGQAYVARLVRQSETLRKSPSYDWANATYLITGGLGGLGIEAAHWLIRQGARHLVLLGRRVPPPRERWSESQDARTREQIAAVRELEALGASVYCAAADIAESDQLTTVLDEPVRRGWPALRGVIHAAGIGHAEKLSDLTPAALEVVLRPKVAGAWALHRALEGRPLDFFVMFSSATHQLGLLGQGVAAYSAANAFLDALAHLRKSRGQPALSICWGPWTQVGMAAQTGNDQRLLGFGIEGITPEPGLRALGHLLGGDRTEAWVLSVEWARLFAADPDLKSTPFVSEIAAVSGTGRESEEVLARRAAWLATLRQAPDVLRQKRLVEHIQDHVVEVMRLESRESVDWRRGLFDIGMDSLMALELKNRLQTSLGLPIPATLAFTYPDVHAMAGYLVKQLFPEERPGESGSEDTEIGEHVAAVALQIQGLDESEMESLMARKLETL